MKQKKKLAQQRAVEQKNQDIMNKKSSNNFSIRSTKPKVIIYEEKSILYLHKKYFFIIQCTIEFIII